MDVDHLEALLARGPIIEDLLGLAQGNSRTPKLLAHAAFAGDLPDSYVLDGVKSALAAAEANEPPTH